MASTNKISPSLKEHLRQMVEEELFSQHREFFRCANHLYEYKWLTEIEIDDQHEYYPYTENIFEKISKIFKRSDKSKIPDSVEVQEYLKELRQEIAYDIEHRLGAEVKTKEALRAKRLERNEILNKDKQDDSHYRKNPDYKLYQNHLSETQWLTQDEFESQDEFTLEVIPFSQKLYRYLLWIIPIALLIVTVVYFYQSTFIKTEPHGYIIVSSNEQKGQLYINEKLKLGISLGQPISLPQRKHHIFYKKDGFLSSPIHQEVNLKNNDTIKIHFSLTPFSKDKIAVIWLKSTHPDAKVFVNNNFYGTARNKSRLVLPPGTYRITLKKDNFRVVPPFTDISVSDGDSLGLSFIFTPRSIVRDHSEDAHGLLEVTANIDNVPIFINGSNSGFYTDYIFNKTPFGSYTISLKKDGYIIDPPEKTIRLTNLNAHQKINFYLQKGRYNISIETTPVNGTLYLDDKKIGTGKWQGTLAPGKYEIRFGRINNYQQPKTTILEINEDSPSKFTFKYLSTYTLMFSPEGVSPKKEFGSIQLGYVDKDGQFHSDPSNAPDISKPDGFSHKVWLMGYAFAYRNPPENDAILFTFDVPSIVDLSNNLWIKMWGYTTDENYPMEFSSTSEIRISVNNRMIQKDYEPEYSIEDAGESRYERFRINNLLHHGKNRILISTGPLNKTFFALWKISLE